MRNYYESFIVNFLLKKIK